VTTALAPNTEALTAADRCDRCGAQAYVGVHPATEHRMALEAAGAVFHDESGRLEASATAPLEER
jgi:hypothetical protein